MKRRPRSSEPPALPPDAARLQSFLLPLHAATEVDELWEAVRHLLRAAFAPCARVTLYLGHFGMREARLVYTDPPMPDLAEWYKARGQINPFTPFIRSHRRVRSYRFSDIVGPPEVFRQSEFYQRFAQVEGWDKGFSGLFWKGDEVKSMFSVYRDGPQSDFGEAEQRCFDFLGPHIETAIDRVAKLHHERLHRKVLEEFNRYIPIGLMLLDWELSPVFANSEAVKECAIWRHGPSVARGLISRELLEVPAAVRAVCERMRSTILSANAKDRSPLNQGLERVTHPAYEGRVASVSAVNAAPGLLALPGFLVVLEDRTREPAERAPGPADQRRPLWMLTPSEREIAVLICEGASNAQIARTLGKSLLTIKKQVTSILAKLDVPSRTRLMALLR